MVVFYNYFLFLLLLYNFYYNYIYVFKNLNKLKIGDEVIIGSKFYTYKYKVVSKKIIEKDDYSIFEGGDERVIILLTCVSDDLRLVVTCK